MERFTICGLRSFVDFINETLPFKNWLFKSTCPRDAYAKVVSYVVQHNI
jgi:hypothetical protein